MEKSQKPKDIIIQILDIAGYGENKEDFADQLLSLCQQQALVDLIKSLPEETILQALKKATENIIKGYLQTISPHLSDTQKKDVQTYIQSLTR